MLITQARLGLTWISTSSRLSQFFKAPSGKCSVRAVTRLGVSKSGIPGTIQPTTAIVERIEPVQTLWACRPPRPYQPLWQAIQPAPIPVVSNR